VGGKLGCASLRGDDLAGHCRRMDDLDGCKKSLRERRKDDLDDLDVQLRRVFQTHTMARQRAACRAVAQFSSGSWSKWEMPVPVVQVVHPHVKGA
jgi:hypothetical protein